MPLLTYFFLGWVGLLGREVRRFNNNINMFPNPTKFGKSQTPYSRLKVAFGPLLPTALFFSGVGIDFTQETDSKKLNPIHFSANTLLTVGDNFRLPHEALFSAVRTTAVVINPIRFVNRKHSTRNFTPLV